MKFLVIYAGRFHPFHKGHKSVYDLLAKQFGKDSVYVTTSGVQAPLTSPFSYPEKVQMMTSLGVPSDHIVQVKNPYQSKELTDQVSDPENTVLVFAVSQKDMEGDSARFKFGKKKDGSPTYLQPLPKNGEDCEPMTEHAYVMVAPTVDFKVMGQEIRSASELRKLYLNSDETVREQILVDLYGRDDPELKHIFDRALEVTDKAEKINSLSQDQFKMDNLTENARNRFYRTVRKIMISESTVRQHHVPLQEPPHIPKQSGYRPEK